MPQASCPRCCKANSPSCVNVDASAWPKMPNIPHSSWNLSKIRSIDSILPFGREFSQRASWEVSKRPTNLSLLFPRWTVRRLCGEYSGLHRGKTRRWTIKLKFDGHGGRGQGRLWYLRSEIACRYSADN